MNPQVVLRVYFAPEVYLVSTTPFVSLCSRTQGQAESECMLLVAYAGPESPAAALRDIGICHRYVPYISVYFDIYWYIVWQRYAASVLYLPTDSRFTPPPPPPPPPPVYVDIQRYMSKYISSTPPPPPPPDETV